MIDVSMVRQMRDVEVARVNRDINRDRLGLAAMEP
jgi:hypothetical protein